MTTDKTTFAGSESRVLVTGGSRGIGRGLAERFHASGARVMITGRGRTELREAEAALPGLLTFAGDIGDAASRQALADHIGDVMPGLGVVINNAGIQRRVPHALDDAPWPEREAEIDILFAAPIHLVSLLLPRMLRSGRPALIVNVTSGGAFIPQPFAPVYAACKAAMHSYTVTLRDALEDTPCRVVELVPPAVATGLAGPGESHGAPLDAFCSEVFPKIASAEADEIGYGPTASDPFVAAMQPYREMFAMASDRARVGRYRAIEQEGGR